MQGMQGQVVPVHRLPDVGNVLHQVVHLLHGVWHDQFTGLARDADAAGMQGILLNLICSSLNRASVF